MQWRSPQKKRRKIDFCILQNLSLKNCIYQQKLLGQLATGKANKVPPKGPPAPKVLMEYCRKFLQKSAYKTNRYEIQDTDTLPWIEGKSRAGTQKTFKEETLTRTEKKGN